MLILDISVTPKLENSDAVIGAGEEGETDMQKSELWTTLFRGGYMAGRLQRSLSGKFVSNIMNETLNEILVSFIHTLICSSTRNYTQPAIWMKIFILLN